MARKSALPSSSELQKIKDEAKAAVLKREAAAAGRVEALREIREAEKAKKMAECKKDLARRQRLYGR
jgi:hypothetical protein